jgi:hypothetical protein
MILVVAEPSRAMLEYIPDALTIESRRGNEATLIWSRVVRLANPLTPKPH